MSNKEFPCWSFDIFNWDLILLIKRGTSREMEIKGGNMSAGDIYVFLNKPLVNILIYIFILVPLVFSLYRYRKGQKEYKYVSIGFVLLLLGRTVQKIIFIFGIKPTTFLGILNSVIVISSTILAIIFIFYLPHRFLKK